MVMKESVVAHTSDCIRVAWGGGVQDGKSASRPRLRRGGLVLVLPIQQRRAADRVDTSALLLRRLDERSLRHFVVTSAIPKMGFLPAGNWRRDL
jgi:hypothetical protein